MKLVIDASMALAWLFKRENLQESHSAEHALLAMTAAETWVPTLWHIEITNALLVGERRQIITQAQTIDYLTRLSGLPFITDDCLSHNRRNETMALAREYKLTAYDATYLELALRHNAQLATFDKALANAMRQAGGRLFSSQTAVTQ